MRPQTQKIARFGLLTALALVLGLMDRAIPVSALLGGVLPGIKLGLANTVLLYAVYLMDWKSCVALMLTKVVLSGFLFGSLSAILFSLSGGVLSLLVMLLLRKKPEAGAVATILLTADGKLIYVPNGALSSGTIMNYTQTPTRRADWTIGIEYGEDVSKARRVVMDILNADKRILKDPAPIVLLGELNNSSVDMTIRCWVDNADYWDVMFQTREKIYNRFNEEGIGFPFPQITVHQGS